MLSKGAKKRTYLRILMTLLSSSGVLLGLLTQAQAEDDLSSPENFTRSPYEIKRKQLAAADNHLNYDRPQEKSSPSPSNSRSRFSNDAKALFELGYKKRHEGKYQDAVVSLEKAATITPDNPDILRELGLVFMSLGEIDKAGPVFRQLLEIIPDDNEAKIALAKIDYAHDNLAEAKRLIGEVLIELPDNVEAKALDTQVQNAIVYQKNIARLSAAKSPVKLPIVDFAEVEKIESEKAYRELFKKRRTKAGILSDKADVTGISGIASEEFDPLNIQDFRFSDSAENLVRNGVNLMSQGKINAAKDAFDDALKLKPTLMSAKLGLAQIFYWQSNFLQAQKIVDNIILEDPKNTVARQFKYHIDAAVKVLQTAKEAQKNVATIEGSAFSTGQQANAGNLYEIGANERKALRFDEAKKHLKAALTLEPDNVDILVQLGLTLLPLGEVDAAKDYFNRALVISPSYTEARIGLARIAYWKGDLVKAKALGEMALSQSPDDEELRKLVSDIDRAIAAKKQIAKVGSKPQLFPSFAANSKINEEIARLSGEASKIVLSGRDFARAEELYKKALRLAPEDVDLLIKLGNVLSFQKKFDEADKIFDRALALAPDAVEAGLGKVNVALWQENYPLARERLNVLLVRYPDNEEVALSNAGLYAAEHHYNKAIIYYEKIIAKNNRNVSAWLGLGNAKRGLLRDREAFEDYQQAKLIAPNNKEISERLAAPIRKRWRLDIDGTYSDLTAPYKNWREGGVALSYQLSETTTITGRLGLSRRFDMDDQQIDLGIAHRFRPGVWGYLSGVVTPKADFLARYILRAGGNTDIGNLGNIGMLGATLDVKSEWYDNGVVKTVSPGLRQTFFKDNVTFYIQWINVIDQKNSHSGGYLLRADTKPLEKLHFNIGYSSTLESSGDKLIPTKATFGSIGFDITEDLTIGFNLAKEKRENAYNRNVFGLSLTRHF